MSDYQRVIDLDPNNLYVYSLSGDTYGKLRNWQQALANYNKAIELNPQDGSTYGDRGALKFRILKDIQGALTDLDRAISRHRLGKK